MIFGKRKSHDPFVERDKRLMEIAKLMKDEKISRIPVLSMFLLLREICGSIFCLRHDDVYTDITITLRGEDVVSIKNSSGSEIYLGSTKDCHEHRRKCVVEEQAKILNDIKEEEISRAVKNLEEVKKEWGCEI